MTESSAGIDELELLQAMFPDSNLDLDEKTISMKIDVCPSSPEIVKFIVSEEEISSRITLDHYPPLILNVKLSDAYPEDEGPSLSIDYDYLPKYKIDKLLNDGQEIWEAERGCMLYTYIDHLQLQSAEFFGLDKLSIDSSQLNTLLHFNKLRKREIFNASYFQCGICLEDKRGSECVALSTCKHLYCDCLKTFFSLSIQEGTLRNIQCPDLDCVNRAILDADLRGIVGDDLFARYQSIAEKQRLDGDPSVTVCPRLTCQNRAFKDSPDASLAQCRTCGYAFCVFCKNGWHGLAQRCKIKNEQFIKVGEEYENAGHDRKVVLERMYGKKNIEDIIRVTLDNKRMREWLDENAKTCPDCGTFIEKSDGCNHMTCGQCKTHFCWLCGDKLNRDNPYKHFNTKGARCYNQLFSGVLVDHNQFEMFFD